MDPSAKSTAFLSVLKRSTSASRFDSYKQMGGTDRDALARYIWNAMLCESLYPGFHILEVAFRNAVHTEMATVKSDAAWLSGGAPFLYPEEQKKIAEARKSLAYRWKNCTEDTLVAETGFGFWTSLLDVRYDTMWPKIIGGVFPNMPRTVRTRANASKPMNTVRKLRNAALHHHSIWHWADLKVQHQQMHLLISYICTPSAALAKAIDRFPSVYSAGHQQYFAVADTLIV
jgi:hypothetical protein